MIKKKSEITKELRTCNYESKIQETSSSTYDKEDEKVNKL